MDRLFLDANVLFSAAYREDSSLGRLWDLKEVVLLTSAYALEEARRNLDVAEQRDRLERLASRMEVAPSGPAHGRPPDADGARRGADGLAASRLRSLFACKGRRGIFLVDKNFLQHLKYPSFTNSY